jgi:hypothetical protein
MNNLTIKGHVLTLVKTKDSYDRRAQQYANRIVESLRRLGIDGDDITLEPERNAIRRVPAAVSWYVEGQHLYYSFSAAGRYVDNLHTVMKVIDAEIGALLRGQLTTEEFLASFSEGVDVVAERCAARELLGVDKNCHEMAMINRRYKELAKGLHPDMQNGSLEEFKRLNNAHKLLRKELT